jgi:sulfatase modifying factor 1
VTAVVPELVTVPSGTTTIDRRTASERTTTVAIFSISPTTITAAQYASVIDVDEPVLEPRRPVTNVTWFAAIEYCNRLSDNAGLGRCYDLSGNQVEPDHAADGFRLPTEAEWQHACRAGTTGARYGELDDIAWYRDNSGGSTHDVATKQPNAWGLFDMLGNVFEWCWDFYDPAFYGEYRVLKGGGWADPPWSCRVGVRRRSSPSFAIDDVGFRVARNARPERPTIATPPHAASPRGLDDL